MIERALTLTTEPVVLTVDQVSVEVEPAVVASVDRCVVGAVDGQEQERRDDVFVQEWHWQPLTVGA